MSKSRFDIFKLGYIESIAEARDILTRNHVNRLFKLFGPSESRLITAEALKYYFNAASKLLKDETIRGGRRKVIEKVVTMYASEKMTGAIKNRNSAPSTVKRKNMKLFDNMNKFKRIVRSK
jgi:hypothetical protein